MGPEKTPGALPGASRAWETCSSGSLNESHNSATLPSRQRWPLLQELVAASRFARSAEMVWPAALCGFRRVGVPVWGIAHVEITPTAYQPTDDGEPAVVLAEFDGGRIVDLIATTMAAHPIVRTRRGVATALGSWWIERAVALSDTAEPLWLHGDPLQWLRAGCVGAVILDWQAAPHTLAGVETMVCADAALARWACDATARPRPRVLIAEGRRHAA